MIRLLLGGVRSGKSAAAEAMFADGTAVTYVASGAHSDESMTERIARHQERRPSNWATVELAEGDDLISALRAATQPVLVDSLGSWLALHHDFAAPVSELVACLRDVTVDVVLVGEEVGLSVHPETELGRRFQDAMGSLNAAVAAVADEAFLVVAGRLLPLQRPQP